MNPSKPIHYATLGLQQYIKAQEAVPCLPGKAFGSARGPEVTPEFGDGPKTEVEAPGACADRAVVRYRRGLRPIWRQTEKSHKTVHRWVDRYRTEGVAGLLRDLTRPRRGRCHSRWRGAIRWYSRRRHPPSPGATTGPAGRWRRTAARRTGGRRTSNRPTLARRRFSGISVDCTSIHRRARWCSA